jgi:hypothetical protein
LFFKGFLPEYKRLSGIKNEIKMILLAVLYLPEKKELNPHDPDIQSALYIDFGKVSEKLTHIEDSQFFAQHRQNIQTMLCNIL